MTHTLERAGGLSSRGLVFGFILLGHFGFFWMMNSGLVSGSKLAERILEVVDVVDPVREEPVEPPLPPPDRIKFEEPVVAPPTLSFDPVAAPEGPTAINLQARPVIDVPPFVPQVVKTIVLPMSNPRRPLTQPPYPPSSQRLGEAGTVILELYVLENGRVGDATVYKSSGYPKLDQAAVEEAKRAWRLIPGTENGQPKAMRYQLGVTFKLNS